MAWATASKGWWRDEARAVARTANVRGEANDGKTTNGRGANNSDGASGEGKVLPGAMATVDGDGGEDELACGGQQRRYCGDDTESYPCSARTMKVVWRW